MLIDMPLLTGGQAPGHSPPEDPPLRPALGLARELKSQRVDFPDLFHAPVVKRGAKPGPHAEAEQIQPAGFMVKGEGPALSAFVENVGEFPDERCGPLLFAELKDGDQVLW